MGAVTEDLGVRQARPAGVFIWAVLLGGLAGPTIAEGQVEVLVPASDGTLLATDIYTPLGAGWPPWPTILLRTPYGKRSALSRNACLAFGAAGFACVAQDVRGRGASGGTNTVFRDDGEDGRVTLRWLAEQSFCSGRIGGFGGSALGITEYAMAPGAAPELDALLPAVATADFYHHAAFQGGVLRWGLVYEWLKGQGALAFLDELRAHRLYDRWWDEVAVLPRMGEVEVPGFHLGGWYDIFLQGTLDAFDELEHHGGSGAQGRQHLEVGPWTHMGLGTATAGELTYPSNASTSTELLASFRDWFDHWLRDGTPGVSTWPKARVYLMGAAGESDAPGNRWLDLQDWPPPASTLRLYLEPEGNLGLEAPRAFGSRRLEMDPRNPVPTRGGANLFETVDGVPQGIGPMDQRPIEGRSDVAVFTTPVLGSPVTVVGRISTRVYLRPDSRDLDLAVRLCDVYPDGRSMLVTDGISRARMRCGDDRECLLVPGEPVVLDVDLWSTALVFNAGHRIRVLLAGSNFPRFEVNPNTGGDFGSADQGRVAAPDLLFGPSHPSCLELPVYRSVRTPRRHLEARVVAPLQP